MWKHVDFGRPTNPLTQIATAGALALALAGCNETAAQRAAPVRPVLVTAVIMRPRLATSLLSARSARGSKATWAFGSVEKS